MLLDRMQKLRYDSKSIGWLPVHEAGNQINNGRLIEERLTSPFI